MPRTNPSTYFSLSAGGCDGAPALYGSWVMSWVYGHDLLNWSKFRHTALLKTFTLKYATRMLPDLLETADLQDSSCREFLLAVLETEVKGRNERRRKRNYSAAHFPPNIRPLEEFDPKELEAGITQAQLTVLKELSWLDNCGNLVFAGPPGLGKTMVACGVELQAVNSGYTVCFEKMTNLIRILDTAATERTAGFRLKNIRKAQLVIIDEIGYTPISRGQANRFLLLSATPMKPTPSSLPPTRRSLTGQR